MARASAWVLLLLALASCSRDARLPQTELTGTAMGTSYSIKLVAPPQSLSAEAIRTDIDRLLYDFEDVTSTYRDDSELSRFNSRATTEWVEVSSQLCEITEQALAISRLTGGAFDITVGPLVNLWGFGPGESRIEPPQQAEIDAALERVGYERLQTRCSPPPAAMRKDPADVYVDLSGWAKGYGVDLVASLLDAYDVDNYLVEIGGEMRMRGVNAEGARWGIGIEAPLPGVHGPQQVVRLSDSSVATSGDYRNYFEHDGKRYSHTIDPESGRPVTHELASVTVLAPSAAKADALATALLVLGPEAGLELAERLELAGYFLIRNEAGLDTKTSSSFDKMVMM